MDSAPYNREEIESLGDAKPTRGVQCPKCKCHIPEFAELDAETTAKLKRMHAGRGMLELRRLTGCSPTWAKIWYLHRDGPHREFGDRNAPDCPHCGEQLRTKLAKQCVACGADWH